METIITTDSGSNPRNMDNMVPCIIVDAKENSYYDMKKMNNDIPVISNIEVFERAYSGERFHTAAPNINDIVTTMRPYLEQGKKIIHLAMSSGISEGSVNGAKVAADMLNEEFEDSVTVIDTLTGGSGGTIMNEYASHLINMDISYDGIIKRLEDVKTRLLTTFYISKVEGFVNSGRAPREAKLLDKLSLRYRIDISSSGKLYPKLPPYHGGINKAFMQYLRNIINDNNKNLYDPNYISLLVTRLII